MTLTEPQPQPLHLFFLVREIEARSQTESFNVPTSFQRGNYSYRFRAAKC